MIPGGPEGDVRSQQIADYVNKKKAQRDNAAKLRADRKANAGAGGAPADSSRGSGRLGGTGAYDYGAPMGGGGGGLASTQQPTPAYRPAYGAPQPQVQPQPQPQVQAQPMGGVGSRAGSAPRVRSGQPHYNPTAVAGGAASPAQPYRQQSVAATAAPPANAYPPYGAKPQSQPQPVRALPLADAGAYDGGAGGGGDDTARSARARADWNSWDGQKPGGGGGGGGVADAGLLARIASLEEQVQLLKHQNRLFVSFMQTTEHTLTALRTSNFAVTAGYGSAAGAALGPAITKAAAAAKQLQQPQVPGGPAFGGAAQRKPAGGATASPNAAPDINDLMQQYQQPQQSQPSHPQPQPTAAAKRGVLAKQPPAKAKLAPAWNDDTTVNHDDQPASAMAAAAPRDDNDDPPAAPAPKPKPVIRQPPKVAAAQQAAAAAAAAATGVSPQRQASIGKPPGGIAAGGGGGGGGGGSGAASRVPPRQPPPPQPQPHDDREGEDDDDGDGGDGDDDGDDGDDGDDDGGDGGDGVPSDPYAGANEPRVECHMCGRKFAASALQRHQAKRACQKSAKKRKVFNIKARRAAEGKLEGKKQDEKVVEAVVAQKKAKWKAERERFREAMRAGKETAQAIAQGKPLPPVQASTAPDDRTECPHCGRKFAYESAQRHIPKCADTKARAKPVGAFKTKKK